MEKMGGGGQGYDKNKKRLYRVESTDLEEFQKRKGGKRSLQQQRKGYHIYMRARKKIEGLTRKKQENSVRGIRQGRKGRVEENTLI